MRARRSNRPTGCARRFSIDSVLPIHGVAQFARIEHIAVDDRHPFGIGVRKAARAPQIQRQRRVRAFKKSSRCVAREPAIRPEDEDFGHSEFLRRHDRGWRGRRIFTERFDGDVLAPRARRTARLDHIAHHLALALGGRPAASFAGRLMMPVSNDTLLRVVRRRGSPAFMAPSVVGIDDWAWRRNQRYGTIICDLERRKTIALLPDREPMTAQAWLLGQPQIAIVARDRGGGYAMAVQNALPNATQVADRWHLMENASHAFLDAVRKSMRQIRAAIGAAKIDPHLLTAAERLQYEGYLRREETNAVILGLSKDGATIKEIVRRTSYSRGLTRAICAASGPTSFEVDRVPSTPIFRGSKRNGRPSVAMVRSCGAHSSNRAFGGACA